MVTPRYSKVDTCSRGASSTNTLMVDLFDINNLGRGSTARQNSRGPKIEPFGTSDETATGEEEAPPRAIQCTAS